jgi:hypothetical protein
MIVAPARLVIVTSPMRKLSNTTRPTPAVSLGGTGAVGALIEHDLDVIVRLAERLAGHGAAEREAVGCGKANAFPLRRILRRCTVRT